MNIGYANGNIDTWNVIFPLCSSNIYVNKYGTDYSCVNKECVLSNKASVVVKIIQGVLSEFSKSYGDK